MVVATLRQKPVSRWEAGGTMYEPGIFKISLAVDPECESTMSRTTVAVSLLYILCTAPFPRFTQ